MKYKNEKEKFRQACDLELSNDMQEKEKLEIRAERLNIFPPVDQDIAERNQLIQDYQRYLQAHNRDIDLLVQLIGLQANCCGSKEDTDHLIESLERCLAIPEAFPQNFECNIRSALLRIKTWRSEKIIDLTSRVTAKLISGPYPANEAEKFVKERIAYHREKAAELYCDYAYG